MFVFNVYGGIKLLKDSIFRFQDDVKVLYAGRLSDVEIKIFVFLLLDNIVVP